MHPEDKYYMALSRTLITTCLLYNGLSSTVDDVLIFIIGIFAVIVDCWIKYKSISKFNND